MLVLLGDLVYHGPRNPLPQGYDTRSVLQTMPDLSALPCPVIAVRGNCDAEVDLGLLPFAVTESAWIEADGLNIFASHGHHLPERPCPGIKPGTVLLRGHHVPRGETLDGLHFWNPGSLSLPKGASPRYLRHCGKGCSSRTGHAGRRDTAPRSRWAVAGTAMPIILPCGSPADTCADTHANGCRACPLFRLCAGYELVLASGSPRRRQFLNEWGLPFVCNWQRQKNPAPCRANRQRPIPGVQPLPRPWLWGRPCHRQCLWGHQAGYSAADTVVAIEGDILGKPQNPAHALSMLERLNGAGHEVISAVCLLLPAQCALAPEASALPGLHVQETVAGPYRMLIFSDVSRVFFHHWPQTVLQAYVDTGEPDDKAGAYAIQGQGSVLVERMEGQSTVVGLPSPRWPRS